MKDFFGIVIGSLSGIFIGWMLYNIYLEMENSKSFHKEIVPIVKSKTYEEGVKVGIEQGKAEMKKLTEQYLARHGYGRYRLSEKTGEIEFGLFRLEGHEHDDAYIPPTTLGCPRFNDN